MIVWLFWKSLIISDYVNKLMVFSVKCFFQNHYFCHFSGRSISPTLIFHPAGQMSIHGSSTERDTHLRDTIHLPYFGHLNCNEMNHALKVPIDWKAPGCLALLQTPILYMGKVRWKKSQHRFLNLFLFWRKCCQILYFQYCNVQLYILSCHLPYKIPCSLKMGATYFIVT